MKERPESSMYYVAVVCPQEINEKVLLYKNRMREQFACVVALKSPAHITLVPPFWLPLTEESSLIETLSSFKPGQNLTKITLDGFSHFGNRVIFIQVKETEILSKLKAETEKHFTKKFKSLKTDDRPFHPHITIANRDLKPGDFAKAWEYFSKQNFHESFDATTVSLLRLSEGKWQVIAENKIH